MSPVPDERHMLEACLARCKERLDHFRRVGNELQTALTEADLNELLDRLHNLYERGARR